MNQLKERIAGMSLDRRGLLEERLLRAHRRSWLAPTIPRRRDTDALWPSFGQQQMWFIDQLTPGTSTYNVPDVMQVDGPLNVDTLENAFRSVVRRHEILRTRFGAVDGSPIPAVNRNLDFKIELFDITSLADSQRGPRADEIIQQQVRKPFNISQDLMLRVILVRLRQDQHRLLILTHHIAWDVSSRAVLYRELNSLYRSFESGRASSLVELPIQYSDFAAWQRQRLQGAVLEEQSTYWRQQLGNAAHVLNIPTDHSRPVGQTFRGAKRFFTLPPAIAESAKVLSREQNSTLFMTLLAAFVAFLNAYTGQSDISVGSPMVGRNYPELEGLIGLFINTTVLRFELSSSTTFRQLVEQARRVTLGAHAHQDLPFEKLVEITNPRRDPSRMALVQVNFRVQTDGVFNLSLPGLKVERMFEFIDTGTSKFDLALELAPDGSGDSFFEYRTDLFDAATIDRIVGDFERVLTELLRQPDVALRELEALAKLTIRTPENIVGKPKMKSLKDFKRKPVDASQNE